MSTLPEYCYEAEIESFDKDTLWGHIEELAYTVDIGVNDPDEDRVTSLIMSYQGQPIGAVWGAPITDTYDFHIAVHPLHQGKGVGGYLLDRMEREFRKAKIENPMLKMDAAVINPRLRDHLMSRGFYVKEEFMESRDEFLYMMTDASTLYPFYEKAKERNLVKCKSIFHEVSVKHNISKDSLKSAFEDWVNAPIGKPAENGLSQAFFDIIAAIPLVENDRAFMLAQHQRQYKTTPNVQKSPEKPHLEQSDLSNIRRRI